MEESGSDYYSHIRYYLIFVQVGVDYRGIFLNAYIEWLGKVQDICVFVNSSFYQ